MKNKFYTRSENYCELLESLKNQLEKRKNNIFIKQVFIEENLVEQNSLEINPLNANTESKTKKNLSLHIVEGLRSIWDTYEELRNKSNSFTSDLTNQQSKARETLRLYEVFTFINNINYSYEIKEIAVSKKEMEEAQKTMINTQAIVSSKKIKIRELKAKLKDESKGADRVNDYLNNFFGHQFLSLKAIEYSLDGTPAGYRFEVMRGEQKAFHLSEGERSLIAFCYFMAKLDDIETKGSQPIIWIDDPISSLDANHIFFVFSLINAKIVSMENYEENGEKKERERFKQLFISTHNLDFLKYLKRLPGALSKTDSQYFTINRLENESHLVLMPKYLKDYVTEFNFLFHQIYRCAHAQSEHDGNHDCYYNFGNNARKFLEAFLYYRYPNASEKDKENKLYRFFGNDTLASSLTNRINNEFSHLEGLFERSILPIDIPEMKLTAKFILQKIKEKDPDQYSALLQSIDESEPTEEPTYKKETY